jgi:hypothetical protein
METIFNGGEGVGSGGGDGKVVEDDATTAWTHKRIWKNKKDILSNLICIHFYQSIVQSR